MARMSGFHQTFSYDSRSVRLDLQIGPVNPRKSGLDGLEEPDPETRESETLGGYTLEQWATIWGLERERIMRDGFEHPLLPIRRPWAWWRFQHDTDVPPENEALALAGMGELAQEELEALEAEAVEARLRIDTPRERAPIDREAVELWEAVLNAL